MTVIREYVPESDAPALAAHFLRSNYGPHGSTRLSPANMAAVLTERAPELFMVAVDGDEIVGCIGFMRGSGRRVARDGELFAGLFVLDPRHRNSLLAGNMFLRSFDRLVERGIRSLRIEANPTNTKAFPLYVRVGFRALPNARADEDGYVELVSHLPGVVGDLLRSDVADELRGLMPKFNWRNAGGGRSISPTTGVHLRPDGTTVISYELSAGEFQLRADVDMETGATLDYAILAGSIDELPNHAGLDLHGPPEKVETRSLGHGITAEADSFGSVRIYTPESLGPVLVDHWPVTRGNTSTGWRRPQRKTVRIDSDDDGWLMTVAETRGTVSRRVLLADGQMSVSSLLTNDDANSELTASPWVSMRLAEKYVVSAEGECIGGPAVRGIWPADYTDFEACADDLPISEKITRAVWRSPATLLEASWPAGAIARHEGNHLPQFRGQSNTPLTYTVRVGSGEQWSPQNFIPPDGINVERVRRIRSPDRLVPVDCAPVEWHPSTRHGKDVLEAGGNDMSLRYSESARGLIHWSHEGSAFLSAPYPGVRNWGPLTDWSAGLWAAIATPRESPEQGVEWVGSTSALPLETRAGQLDDGSWNVKVGGGAIPTVEVAAVAPPSPGPGEMAFYVTPTANPGAPVLIGHKGKEKWLVEATSQRWSLGTTRIAVELQDGRYLVVRPVHGLHQEIFVRSEHKGIHLSLLSRLGTATADSRWRLSVLPHRSAALLELDR